MLASNTWKAVPYEADAMWKEMVSLKLAGFNFHRSVLFSHRLSVVDPVQLSLGSDIDNVTAERLIEGWGAVYQVENKKKLIGQGCWLWAELRHVAVW